MVRLDFPTTNNEVEYETLVVGLDLTKAAGAARVVLYCDSQVVTNQVNKDYECRGKRMKRYLDQGRRRVDELKAKIIQIPRRENEQADRLAKAASAEHMTTFDNVLFFFSAFSTNRYHRCAGDRFRKQLDHAVNLLLEKWRLTRRKGGHKKAEGPSSSS